MYKNVTPETIKKNLIKICSGRGITLTSLSRQTGIDIHTMYNWKTSYPNLLKLMKIADFFVLSIDDIIFQDRAEKASQKR